MPTIPRQTSNQESNTSSRIPRYLLALLAVYCAASLIHFVHNAEFVSAYPNLPAGLTRSKVYLAWLAITAVGAAGIFVVRLGARLPGLLLIAAYAALGFAGLDHYWVAADRAYARHECDHLVRSGCRRRPVRDHDGAGISVSRCEAGERATPSPRR